MYELDAKALDLAKQIHVSKSDVSHTIQVSAFSASCSAVSGQELEA